MGTLGFVSWLVFFVEEKLCLTGQKDIVKSTSPVNSRVCLLALVCMFHTEWKSEWELYLSVSRPGCIVTVLDWLTFTFTELNKLSK